MLFTIYPRSGDSILELYEEMNGFITSTVAVIELSLVAEPIRINEAFLKSPVPWTAMDPGQLTNVTAFILFLVLFIVLSIVLLLNLLIALLTSTFDSVRESSMLTSRLIFARSIIRLELVAESFGMCTRCGERQRDGRYTYNFRSVESRYQFGADAGDGYAGDLHGGANPFEEPLPTPMGRVEGVLAELRGQVEGLSVRLETRPKGDNNKEGTSVTVFPMGATAERVAEWS